MKNASKFYLFSFFLVIGATQYGCNKNQSEKVTTNKGLSSLKLFIGQAYPSKHVILQKVSSGITEKNKWPKSISFAPLVPPTSDTVPATFNDAKYFTEHKDVYIPELEKMPAIHASKCTPANYKSNSQYEYSLNKTLVDFFDRGFSDNCELNVTAALYKADKIIKKSYPVIGINGVSDNVEISYNNFNKPLKLNAQRKKQVKKYIEDFRLAYKKAYGSDYNENIGNIGKIPTLVEARILAEITDKTLHQTIRISMWERITIAQHIYRVIVFDFLENGNLIESRELGKAQGVLG